MATKLDPHAFCLALSSLANLLSQYAATEFRNLGTKHLFNLTFLNKKIDEKQVVATTIGRTSTKPADTPHPTDEPDVCKLDRRSIRQIAR